MNLFLRLMQRQITDIILLPTVGAKHNAFGLAAVADHHAITLAKELGSVEIVLYLKRLLGDGDLLNAVEREHGETAVVKASQQIPTLTEQLDAIGRQGEGPGFRGLVAAVMYHHTLVVFHGLDHLLQIHALRRDVLQHDAMLQAHALADEVVYREGGEHPVLHCVLTQHLLVADVIAVAVAPVTVDIDAEDVLDGVLVAVESGAAQGDALAHLGAQPFLVDLGEGDFPSAVDGVYQPDVFFE